MTQNKISPLEQLRLEKEAAKLEVAESEDRLSGQWDYMRSNLSTLIVNGIIDSTLKGFGLKSSKNESETTGESNSREVQPPGIFKSLLGGFAAVTPLVWELAQPMLMNFALRKIKSIFTGDKKKKKKKSKD